MGEKKHGSGPYMKATAVSVEQAVMSPGGSQVIADELNQLLRDVRVLQDCHYKQHALRNCTENGGFEKTFSEYMAALDKAEQSGALTRWGGGGR